MRGHFFVYKPKDMQHCYQPPDFERFSPRNGRPAAGFGIIVAMHEWALAEAVLDTAEKAAKDGKLKAVRSVVVRVGELQRMELDALRFCLEEIRKSRPALKAAALEIETEPAEFSCKACAKRWTLRDLDRPEAADEVEHIHFVPEMAHVYLRCTSCGSPDFEVIKGRGVLVARITGDA